MKLKLEDVYIESKDLDEFSKIVKFAPVDATESAFSEISQFIIDNPVVWFYVDLIIGDLVIKDTLIVIAEDNRSKNGNS